jgi:hypothetical protein
VLTADEARDLAIQWRGRFTDEQTFETSWSRFFDMVGDPTVSKLEGWLAKDLAKDEVRHAGIVKEPLLPTRSRFTATLGECPTCGGDVHACHTCHGLGYVRRDLNVGHPDFGKAIRCPRCSR